MSLISFDKIIKTLKDKIIFYFLLFSSFVYILSKVLDFYNLEFRLHVGNFFAYVSIISFTCGVIQLLLKIRKRAVKIIAIFFYILVMTCVVLFFEFIMVFGYSEQVGIKNDVKYVAKVYSFLKTYVDYHKYVNCFVNEKQVSYSEYLGRGTHYPFD